MKITRQEMFYIAKLVHNRNIQNNNQMASWYDNYNPAAKQLESFLNTKPTFTGMITSLDLIGMYSQKEPVIITMLQNYLASCPSVGPDIATYISVPPSPTDTDDRKYKLPMMAVFIVELEIPCILDALLKPIGPNMNAFLMMFEMFKKTEILPLLAGYFYRVNSVLFRTRYNQMLDSVFSSNQYLQQLFSHSYHSSIASCLTYYLCIDSAKNFLSQDKMIIMLATFRSILDKIQSQRMVPNQRSIYIIENLLLVLREVIERYHLIINGKQMLEMIMDQKFVQLVVSMIGQESQHSFPAMTLSLSFLKYLSLSSMNLEQPDQQKMRKNMQRIDSQPFVRIMLATYRSYLEKVKREKTMTLYGFHLLEVLCHFMTLASYKIFNMLKQTQLFPTLFDLLFKHEQNNILHKLIERTFSHIFSGEKIIYQQYKQYLFCNISLIDLTAKRLLDLYPGNDCFEKAKSTGYFGVLIKIIKIYSSIVTTNLRIRQAITSKTEVWSKMSKKILKPYQAVARQNLGQMENVPTTVPIQFTVRKIQNQIMQRLLQNSEAIEQIKKEEQTMPKTLELTEIIKQTTTLSDPNTTMSSGTKIEDDSFFKSPLEDSINKAKVNFEFINNNRTESNRNISAQVPPLAATPQIHKRSSAFAQYMASEKIKVGEEIQLKRTQSGEKRLSADKKTRLTSQSPSRKKNNWVTSGETQQKKQDKRVSLVKDLPKIPNAHKPSQLPSTPTHQNHSTLNQISSNMTSSSYDGNKLNDEDMKKMTTSMPNLHSLKNVTVVRTTQQPAQKKFRKVQEKDKVLFDFLGLKY